MICSKNTRNDRKGTRVTVGKAVRPVCVPVMVAFEKEK